jgi:MIP family channel proteins
VVGRVIEDLDADRRRALAEFLATFGLVFVGAASVVAAGPIGSGLLGIAIAHGAVLVAVVAATWTVSGGVANPAITLALWILGRLPATTVGVYVGAQVAGAIVAAMLLRLVLPEVSWRLTSLGTPLPAPEVGGGKAIVLEAILTFVLAIAYLAATRNDDGERVAIRVLPVGLAYTAVILAGWSLTGAAANPARQFGPALVSWTWTIWWAYWIGPAAGAALAAAAYWMLERGRRAVDTGEATGEATDG